MNQNKSKDPLRDLNWASVYCDVPEDFDPAVRLAFQRIRVREKRKKNIIRFTACAAALAVCLGVGAWQLGRRENAPDNVEVVLAAPEVITLTSPVLSTMDDPYLHIDAACPQAIQSQVELQLLTALEFEKTPCPVCCANAVFEEQAGIK